jgi:capsular polysaccharide biosynthesis protein
MSEQAVDLRRSMRIVRRHKIIVGIAAGLGLLAGVAFTVLHPPMLTSKAVVVLPSSASKYVGTQVVVAGSTPVLAEAVHKVNPPVSLQTLRERVHVSNASGEVIAISGQGKTAAQAESIANAVASSYVSYISSRYSPTGPVHAHTLGPASPATGTPLAARMAITGGVGLLAGIVIGALVALAVDRGDKRLRERDEISDAIGVPVLASLPVRHPSNPAAWTRLLDDYKPGAVQAWSLRKTLQHLGLTDVRGGNGASLAVLSLSSDRGALALGPQLAVYAASLGIPTALVIGPQQDANVTAALRAACGAPLSAQSNRSRRLRVSVRDQEGAELPKAPLTVVVTVVDTQAPEVAGSMRAATMVLGVSAGVVTAEQLARVAVSAAGDGRQIAGIMVADPDPTDHTSGRLLEMAPATHRKPSAWQAGATTGSTR